LRNARLHAELETIGSLIGVARFAIFPRHRRYAHADDGIEPMFYDDIILVFGLCGGHAEEGGVDVGGDV
jgi:hypothetical protein